MLLTQLLHDVGGARLFARWLSTLRITHMPCASQPSILMKPSPFALLLLFKLVLLHLTFYLQTSPQHDELIISHNKRVAHDHKEEGNEQQHGGRIEANEVDDLQGLVILTECASDGHRVA